MKTWQIAFEARLAGADAPPVLPRDLLARIVRSARGGVPLAPSTLTHWLASARARGRLAPVRRGLYLNRFRGRPGLVSDATQALRQDAVVSLNTVLAEAGVLNNSSHVVTAVVPIDAGAPAPKLGREPTAAGVFQFFGLPRRVLEAGTSADRLEPVERFEHVRATPEKALADWLYLAKSPRSRRTLPPQSDLDLSRLDRARLTRLAKAMDLTSVLDAWLADGG